MVQLVYIPTFPCGHKLWVAIERMRLQIKPAQMKRVVGLSDLRSLNILGVNLLPLH